MRFREATCQSIARLAIDKKVRGVLFASARQGTFPVVMDIGMGMMYWHPWRWITFLLDSLAGEEPNNPFTP